MSRSPTRGIRRRTGSTARRYHPSQLVQVNAQQRIPRETILAGIAVAIVAAALIALIWIMATRSATEHRVAQREDVERGLAAQAATLAEKVKLELQVVDQSLTIMQALWAKDPYGFKLADWHKQVPALTSVSDDIFIADDKRIIQQDILPQAVGQGVGAAYLPFPHGSLEVFEADGARRRESRVITPTSNATIEARRYLMYVVRPLGDPPKLAIGASFRSGELTRHFADGALGANGMVAMIEHRQGVLQAVAGPAARRPRANLARTDMFEAMRKTDLGTWIGPTGVDGIMRVHAWAKVPTRDSIIVVASPTSLALGPGEMIASATIAIASMATAVVIAVGALVTWGIASLRANRRRQRAHERMRADLGTAQAELAANRLRATNAASQLRALLDGVTEAAAVFDAELRLSTWNDRFQLIAGLPESTIQEGLPLDEMLRQQCHAGLFGTHPDPEVEIARRVQTLMLSDGTEQLTQTGPQGAPIPVLARRMPDTGLVLILGGLDTWQAPPRPTTPAPAPVTQMAAPAPEPAPSGATVEW